MSNNQHTVETPKEREKRLQRMSTNQHERLVVETPEERKKDYSECPQYCPETDRAGHHPTVYK